MPDPNNIVLNDHRLAFMLIPKVANTSIKMAMLNMMGIYPKEPRGLNHYMGCRSQHGNVFHVEQKSKLATDYADYLRIAFVRNPFDRILSCYRDKVLATHHRSFTRFGIAHGDSLRKFINIIKDVPDNHAEQHFRSQSAELIHNDNLVPDFVGRFETIDSDWHQVQSLALDQCGLILDDLPHVNKSSRFDIEMDNETRADIATRYKCDFESFGYSYD
jgi:dermatan 4-sulfotransferase 1